MRKLKKSLHGYGVEPVRPIVHGPTMGPEPGTLD